MKRRTLLAAAGGAALISGAGWLIGRPDPVTGLLPGAAMPKLPMVPCRRLSKWCWAILMPPSK